MISHLTTITRKTKTAIIVSVILVILFIISAITFLFGLTPIHYDNIESGITYTENSGNIEFEYFLTSKGGSLSGSISTPVIYDYDDGVRYHYYYFTIYAQRWNIWLHPGKDSHPYFILDKTGKEIHSGENTSHYTKDELIENPGLLSIKYIRVYYLNPDGSLVLVWEHPDAQLIIERTQTDVKSPDSYFINTTGKIP